MNRLARAGARLAAGPQALPSSVSMRPVGRLSSAAAAASDTGSVLDVPYGPGDVIHGFEVERVTSVDDYQLTAVQLRHTITGSPYLHLARDDPNNVFAVGFRTTPDDSTGVPHILEHTVLCGSELYPCRDPFFKMLNRSLATFMNAMTASDWTMYPFSTTNRQDFYNLLGVYLDAAFFPNLEELDFLQEGWRLEHEDPLAPDSNIVFKGVVYNEMKGALSSPDALFCYQAQQQLHPGTTYEHMSGGDPSAITDLTYQALKDFHSEYYHPSNARFYSYGDLPLGPHLEELNRHVLERFERSDGALTAVGDVHRWSEPKKMSTTCPEDAVSADPDRPGRISVSYLLPAVSETQEQLTLRIIGMLLVDGPSSPFFKSLVESGLGADFSPNTGFDGNTRETSFAVGLQGAHPDDFEKIEAAITATLVQVVAEGFDMEQVDAILHQVELSQKHQSSSFGLNLGMGLMGTVTHDCDPVEALQINAMIERFQADIKDPAFLTSKVTQHFLENPHRLTFTMTPDPDYNDKLAADEQARLAVKVEQLDAGARQQLLETGQALLEAQDGDDGGECLPSLAVGDIDRDKAYPAVLTQQFERLGDKCDIDVVLSEQPTNGVLYFRSVIDTESLPDELQDYVPLFCSVLCALGTERLSYRELAQQIKSTSGGFTSKVHLARSPVEVEQHEQGVRFMSYCLGRNIETMFATWSEIFANPNFEERDYLKTLIAMDASDMGGSIAQSGHTFAQLLAASSVSSISALSNRHTGLEQIALTQSLAAMDDLDDVVAKLKRIGDHVLRPGAMRVSAVGDEATLNATMPKMLDFLTELQPPATAAEANFTGVGTAEASERALGGGAELYLPGSSTFVKTPFNVNYAARSIPTVPYSHPDSATLSVLGKAMSAKFLHREIREKGGAYGGGAAAQNGLFHFYSYRDPNTSATLDAFDAAVNWAADGNITQKDIDEAKLSIFQGVDAPTSPGNRGTTMFLSGISDAQRQARREHLLDVTTDAVKAAAADYLATPGAVGTAIVGTEDGAELFEKNAAWTVRSIEL